MANLTREDMDRSVSLKPKTHYDFTLLFLIVFLVGFGIIMINSISSYNATKYYNDSLLFVKGQLKNALVGLALLLLISVIDYHIFIVNFKVFRPVTIVYLICIALQFLVLFIGHSTNGSSRWLFGFQPSEVSKLGVILYFAYIVQKSPKRLDSFFGFLRIIVYVAPIAGLVVVENLSTAAILVAIAFVICFVTSRKKRYYIFTGLFLFAFGVAGILAEGYRAERLDNWLNVETAKDAYQIRQGLYALASGGWFGKGLGNGIQKLGYIPEVHTDMILTCICEELGLIGVLALMALFGIVLWRIFLIGLHAPDLFGSLICCGVFTQIAVQILINVAVITNTIPATGIPLPFVSYGGSSLVIIMAEIGLVLSVAKRIDYNK